MTNGFSRCRVWLAVLGLSLGVSACTKERQATKCQADTDCNNGTLCEMGVCVPSQVAEKARAFDQLKAKEKNEPSEKKTADTQNEGPVPIIPNDRSDPPKYEEWQTATEINTQHEHGRARECTMKVVREWVRVLCRGEILGYQDVVEFGKKTVDYYVSVKESSLSFVGRIKRGPRQSVRICRKTDRAALVVHWPDGADRPQHIALGGGGPCENHEFDEVPANKAVGGEDSVDSAPAGSARGNPSPPRPSGLHEGHMTPKGIARD